MPANIVVPTINFLVNVVFDTSGFCHEPRQAARTSLSLERYLSTASASGRYSATQASHGPSRRGTPPLAVLALLVLNSFSTQLGPGRRNALRVRHLAHDRSGLKSQREAVVRLPDLTTVDHRRRVHRRVAARAGGRRRSAARTSDRGACGVNQVIK